MLATPFHLLLMVPQQVEHGGVIVKLAADGHGLDKHSMRVDETLVAASVVGSGCHRSLFAGIACQQVGVCRSHQRALIDTIVAAELLHPLQIHVQGALSISYRIGVRLSVWHQPHHDIIAVKMLGIPLPPCLADLRRASCLLLLCIFCQRQHLGIGGSTAVCHVNVMQQDLLRRAVVYDMVCVEEKIEMLIVLQQAHVEQPSSHQLEWLDEAAEVPFLRLLHRERQRFLLYMLHGDALVVQPQAGEERGVSQQCRLHCPAKALPVQ